MEKIKLIDIKKRYGGFFIEDNLSLWYSPKYKWYLKDARGSKEKDGSDAKTIDIKQKEASRLLKEALKE